jgi:hypothetical protein
MSYPPIFHLVLVVYTFNTTRIRNTKFIDNCYTYKNQIQINRICLWKVKPTDVQYAVAQNIGC